MNTTIDQQEVVVKNKKEKNQKKQYSCSLSIS